MGWRVGATGLRVIHRNDPDSWLPPGSILDALPDHYEGDLERIDEPEQPKRISGYQDKAIHPGLDIEDKGQ